MRLSVNAVDQVLPEAPQGVAVVRLGDRLLVRTPEGSKSALVARRGDTTWVSYGGSVYRIERAGASPARVAAIGSGKLRAPMPGLIVDVRFEVGQSVKQGETVIVLEAMKTQQPLVAPFDGVLVEMAVTKGLQVTDDQLLACLEPQP